MAFYDDDTVVVLVGALDLQGGGVNLALFFLCFFVFFPRVLLFVFFYLLFYSRGT